MVVNEFGLAELQATDHHLPLEGFLDVEVDLTLRPAISLLPDPTQHSEENALILLSADALEEDFLVAEVVETDSLL